MEVSRRFPSSPASWRARRPTIRGSGNLSTPTFRPYRAGVREWQITPHPQCCRSTRSCAGVLFHGDADRPWRGRRTNISAACWRCCRPGSLGDCGAGMDERAIADAGFDQEALLVRNHQRFALGNANSTFRHKYQPQRFDICFLPIVMSRQVAKRPQRGQNGSGNAGLSTLAFYMLGAKSGSGKICNRQGGGCDGVPPRRARESAARCTPHRGCIAPSSSPAVRPSPIRSSSPGG